MIIVDADMIDRDVDVDVDYATAAEKLPLSVTTPRINNGRTNHTSSVSIGMDSLIKRRKPTIAKKMETRRALFEQRKQLSDVALSLALCGLLIMMAEMEFTAGGLYTKASSWSFALKSVLSISTLALAALIALYHALEIQMFLLDGNVSDWRIALTWRRCVVIVLELLVCLVHPVPGDYSFEWTTNSRTEMVSIDVFLSLPMFLRLYLVFRVILLHSKFFNQSISRSIGAFCRIDIDTHFVVKAHMTSHPGTSLILFFFTYLLIASWCLRSCERFHEERFGDPLNSLWLIATTFISAGYGDIVPNTTCGRGVCVCTGLMGLGCTALAVAVIARKLKLTYAEKHVHDFIADVELTEQLKNSAANVLRETWILYRHKKFGRRSATFQKHVHQRKLLEALRDMHEAKLIRREMLEELDNSHNIAKTQDDVHSLVTTVDRRTASLEEDVKSTKEQLRLIYDLLQSIHPKPDQLPQRRALRLPDRTNPFETTTVL